MVPNPKSGPCPAGASPDSLTPKLEKRSKEIELLEAYSLFLEKNGYMDIDWRTEPPFAIDEFLKTR